MMGDPQEPPIRLLLVEDHALFRRGLRRLLEGKGFDVVGEAANGKAAVALAGELEPDVIVMDLSMPVMSGVEAIERIVAMNPEARILVLTISAGEDEVLDALVAGACGYVLKDARAEEIGALVRERMESAADLMLSRSIDSPRPLRSLSASSCESSPRMSLSPSDAAW